MDIEINDDILEFDINLLEVEVAKQPKIFFKYAVEMEDAGKRLDNAERELKVIDAELDTKIRSKEKLTETAIKSQILLHKRHQEQEKKISKRRHKYKMYQHFVTSLDQRKRMIEKAVDLHGQKYFATPTPNQRNKEHLAELEKQAIRSKGRK